MRIAFGGGDETRPVMMTRQCCERTVRESSIALSHYLSCVSVTLTNKWRVSTVNNSSLYLIVNKEEKKNNMGVGDRKSVV